MTSREYIIIVLLIVVCVYVVALRIHRSQSAVASTTDREIRAALADRGAAVVWPYIPLIVFAALCVGPSVLAPIFYMVSSIIDISGLVGRAERPPDLTALLFYPFLFFLPYWPFLALYGVTRDALIRDPSSQKSIRLAMIVSTIAMALPSSLFLVETPGEMMSSARDAGQGVGILAFFYVIFLPFPGIVGWFIGRSIACIVWR
jgi:hypothetical protein